MLQEKEPAFLIHTSSHVPFMAREAILSSKKEGNQATLLEILAQDAGVYVDRNLDDLQEVHNYILT